MFVLKSKYRKLEEALEQRRLDALALSEKLHTSTIKYIGLLRAWNDLVPKYNALQRISLVNAEQPPKFSDDDLKKLLLLCHPDKHDGKPMAVEITAKLLAMRK